MTMMRSEDWMNAKDQANKIEQDGGAAFSVAASKLQSQS